MLAKDTILSGPLAEWWERLRAELVGRWGPVGFKGGTSTDVFCVPAGEGLGPGAQSSDRDRWPDVAGTAAADSHRRRRGGSILSVEEQRLQVGLARGC